MSNDAGTTFVLCLSGLGGGGNRHPKDVHRPDSGRFSRVGNPRTSAARSLQPAVRRTGTAWRAAAEVGLPVCRQNPVSGVRLVIWMVGCVLLHAPVSMESFRSSPGAGKQVLLNKPQPNASAGRSRYFSVLSGIRALWMPDEESCWSRAMTLAVARL